MKEVKVVVRDFRNENFKNLMEEHVKEFLDIKEKEIKKEEEEESSNEVKNDPDERFLFAYEQKPKMPKGELMRLEVRSSSRKKNFSDHQCEICQKYLSSKKSLKVHIKHHFKPNNYECKKCKKVFVMEHNFKIHKCINDLSCPHCSLNFTQFRNVKHHVKKVHKLKMPDDKFSCDFCGAWFILKQNLALHVLKCSTQKEGKYFCDSCDKKFYLKGQLKSHVLIHAVHQIECEVCLKKMKPGPLRGHMANFHPKSVEKFECKKCLKVFQNAQALKAHMKIHGKKFKCSYCSSTFRNQYELNQHKIFHENPELLQCKICGHQATQKATLETHLRLHDKNYVKRFHCNLCNYKTDNKRHFCDHKKIHKKSEEKLEKYPNSIKCTKCPSVLKNQQSYIRHLRYKHGDKKIFQCDLCERSCVVKRNIKNHMMNKHLKIVKK